ncbi:MAG: putative DNA binding domain-containing protein [Deltaproteobacteria bacterium]|nr:putative DNA binding domain-containing protein [Deltaproteobacteria bacterium]
MGVLQELRKLPAETEWFECKHNNDNPEEIGEYLSALANSAAFTGKTNAYLVWGVDNLTHEIIGTTFRPILCKIGNEELESWLLRQLAPKINFRFHEIVAGESTVVLLEIGAAFRHPVQFRNTEYIRVGSYKKKLKDFPEKERELWRVFDKTPFEREIAAENIGPEELFRLLDYPAYFDLLKSPLPESRDGILAALQADEIIAPGKSGKWNITNLGAVMFAKKLSDFRSLKRKAVRVIQYKGENRVVTVREQEGAKGYACGFEGLIGFVINLLPSNEVIGQALRREV